MILDYEEQSLSLVGDGDCEFFFGIWKMCLNIYLFLKS